ncbi:MAG: FG-GAP repeat protein [Holophagales bacterium]|nr:FG-GAP repeat protein [Holophagales bacterium]
MQPELTSSHPLFDLSGWTITCNGAPHETVVVCCGSVVLGTGTSAPLWQKRRRLVDPNPSDEDFVGTGVAVDGDFVAVGNRNDDDFGTNAGSVLIFERNSGETGGWDFVQKIRASEPRPGALFGFSLSLDGSTLVVGAVGDDEAANRAGAAYVFDLEQNGDWREVAKLAASDAAAEDSFGTSVGISGDTVVIGARFDDDHGNGSGSAYVFERNQVGMDTWGQVAKLHASDPAAGDQFGLEVTISGDTIAVQAHLDDTACPADHNCNSGSVHIYGREVGGPDRWGHLQKITASDASRGDEFGRDLELDNDVLVIGTAQDEDGPGKAYILQRDFDGTWFETKKLFPVNGEAGDGFGKFVEVSGETVAVTALRDNGGGVDSGSLHIFSRHQGGADSWGLVQELIPPDAGPGDHFGRSVALSGTTLVVGSHLDDHSGFVDAGSACVYEEIVASDDPSP